MHLSAAILLPLAVRERLEQVVADVRLPVAEHPRRRGSSGFLARLGGRGDDDEVELPADDQLDRLSGEHLRIDMAGFGNVGRVEAHRLNDALVAAASKWPAPRVRVAGATVLDWKGGDSAWARLDGQVDRVETIGRSIPDVAKTLQLFVDRRRFRPLIRLGAVNDRTTALYLERLLSDLECFESDWWVQSSFSLLEGLHAGPGKPAFRHFADIPLAAT
jgi:hypothetical protein